MLHYILSKKIKNNNLEERGKYMTISEVSEKYGLSRDTLRYYERVGIIPPVHRTSGGLRDYTEEDCKWVELVKCMRSAGLSVEVLKEYVNLTQQGSQTFLKRRELLVQQREQLVAQMQVIQETIDRLDYKIAFYDEAMETKILKCK